MTPDRFESGPLVECAPNFSEGRDRGVVEAIAAAIESPGARVLDVTLDPDHNRSVITFAGRPEAVRDAAVRAAVEAAARIDLRRHDGVHPRIGAMDVLPFVPWRGAGMAECASLAVETAGLIWRLAGVPSYLYEYAARRPDRRNLADVRRGQFEGLLEAATRDPARAPDIGGPALHASAGAIAVGAREFLIAFNVNLASADLTAARDIARRIRESTGGLPNVKALGLELRTEGLTQVSVNLTDFRVTSIRTVFDAIRGLAAQRGIGVKESELIGLAPRAALDEATALHAGIRGFHPKLILENRLASLNWDFPCSSP